MVLNKKIKFIEQTTKPDDEGFRIEEFSEKYSCWANVYNITNCEFNKGAAVATQVKCSFRVRYCKFTKDLIDNSTTYKIIYNNKLFNILGANDYKDQHIYIDVKGESTDV